jgi:hypothetical protein
MDTAVEFVPFRGRVYKLDGLDLKYLEDFQGQGETLEQALERIYIEAEEDERLQQQLPLTPTPTYNRNTMDYYLLAQ